MGCNGTQKEVGGKDLLVKKCKLFSAIETTATSANIEITAHGAKVGDVIKFSEVDGNTTINTTAYFAVVEIVDVDTLKVATKPGGTPLVMDDTSAIVVADVYRQLGGLRTKEFSFSSEAVDVTNSDSNEWKSMLDGAGMRSCSFSGGGVYTAETVFREFRQDFLDNKNTCVMLLDAKTKEIIDGCFKISELSISGSYDGEGEYSVSGESSGPIVTFLFPS